MRQNAEERIHVAVAQFLGAALADDVFWTSLENRPRSAVQGARNKARGVRAGIPDILVIHLGIPHWIELKAVHGSVSKEQREIMPKLERAGCRTAVCRGVGDVEAVLLDWGVPMKGRIAA